MASFGSIEGLPGRPEQVCSSSLLLPRFKSSHTRRIGNHVLYQNMNKVANKQHSMALPCSMRALLSRRSETWWITDAKAQEKCGRMSYSKIRGGGMVANSTAVTVQCCIISAYALIINAERIKGSPWCGYDVLKHTSICCVFTQLRVPQKVPDCISTSIKHKRNNITKQIPAYILANTCHTQQQMVVKDTNTKRQQHAFQVSYHTNSRYQYFRQSSLNIT